jgi:hypothetical protein
MNNPWLPYLVTDYIRKLQPRRVFEWGSGNSTVFFLGLGAEVVSIEHDSTWYIETTHPRLIKHLIPYDQGSLGNDSANPSHYKSGSTNLGDVNFKRYASAIDDYGLFDLILIDGMARASCLHHAINHVNEGGCIVLDNTGDRPYYLEQTAHLFGNYEDGWESIKFMGYGPILAYKWETSIFINKRKSHYE